jgi:hypothetical protein
MGIDRLPGPPVLRTFSRSGMTYFLRFLCGVGESVKREARLLRGSEHLTIRLWFTSW